jgi:hypothetical protein
MSSNAVDALSVDTAHSLGLEPPAGSPEGKRNFPSEWIARCVIISTGGALAWYTWGHWGDFQVDSGRELYVPAAILKGQLLFRDLWYMYGPLAPYVKALLFWIFGVHLTVLYIFGLLLTVYAALITFEVAGQMNLEMPVRIVPSLFLLTEAFYPCIRNFVFPYSYAASLGSCLGLMCLYFVLRYASTRRTRDLGLAALIASLVILTKQEFGVACLALLGFEVVASFHGSLRELVKNVGLCLAGLSPALAVYAWFVWKLSARIVFFENWISTPGTYFMRTFGKRTMAHQGFRFVPAELLEVAEYALLALALWYVLAFLNASVIRKLALKSRPLMLVPVLLSMLPLGIISFVFFRHAPSGMVVDTRVFARSVWEQPACFLFTSLSQAILPSGLFLLVLFFLVRAIVNLRSASSNSLAVQEICLGIYAALVGVRQMMELQPSLYEGGVFFNVPAFMIFVILVDRTIRWASRSLNANNRSFVAGSMLVLESVFLFFLFPARPGVLPARLSTDYGTFYTKPDIAVLFPQIISFMKTHTENGKDILVVPEPPSLYVFAGMEAPSRWYSLVQGYVPPPQEREYINEIKSNYVKYVLIGNREEWAGYATSGFGENGYNHEIYRWIMANYERVGQFGPVQGRAAPATSYVMSIYQRKEAAAAH